LRGEFVHELFHVRSMTGIIISRGRFRVQPKRAVIGAKYAEQPIDAHGGLWFNTVGLGGLVKRIAEVGTQVRIRRWSSS
jgi:hypothetical protein